MNSIEHIFLEYIPVSIAVRSSMVSVISVTAVSSVIRWSTQSVTESGAESFSNQKSSKKLTFRSFDIRRRGRIIFGYNRICRSSSSFVVDDFHWNCGTIRHQHGERQGDLQNASHISELNSSCWFLLKNDSTHQEKVTAARHNCLLLRWLAIA